MKLGALHSSRTRDFILDENTNNMHRTLGVLQAILGRYTDPSPIISQVRRKIDPEYDAATSNREKVESVIKSGQSGSKYRISLFGRPVTVTLESLTEEKTLPLYEMVINDVLNENFSSIVQDVEKAVTGRLRKIFGQHQVSDVVKQACAKYKDLYKLREMADGCDYFLYDSPEFWNEVGAILGDPSEGKKVERIVKSLFNRLNEMNLAFNKKALNESIMCEMITVPDVLRAVGLGDEDINSIVVKVDSIKPGLSRRPFDLNRMKEETVKPDNVISTDEEPESGGARDTGKVSEENEELIEFVIKILFAILETAESDEQNDIADAVDEVVGQVDQVDGIEGEVGQESPQEEDSSVVSNFGM